MNCPECGQDTERSFCTKCGAQVDAVSEGTGAGAQAFNEKSEGGQRDPKATGVINHRELKEMLAQVPVGEATRAGTAERDPQITIPRMLTSTVTQVLSRPRPQPPSPVIPISTGEAVIAEAGTSPDLPAQTPGVPVQITIEMPRRANRVWAIPLVGWLGKVLVLVPQLLALFVVSVVALAVSLAAPFAVLLWGRYPSWAARWTGGAIRWQTRFHAYLFGLVDRYPPFSLDDAGAYPVHVAFTIPERSSRFWAIPIVGLLARIVVLLPHLVILYALWLVVAVLQLVLWAPVVIKGRMSALGCRYVGGTIRYQALVLTFLYGLNDTYPTFHLGK